LKRFWDEDIVTHGLSRGLSWRDDLEGL